MDKERIIRIFAGYFPENITSDVEMLDQLNRGFPFEALIAIERNGIVSQAELREFIAPRTLARRKSEKRLSVEESDLVARLARIHDFASEVFGNGEKGAKWLRTPNRALKGEQPLYLLKTDYGARIVESILGRIDHGIYS